jgi:hypothetical protein
MIKKVVKDERAFISFICLIGLQCHSCSGKADCESLISLFPDRSGRCQIDLGKGKCFIRRDPNSGEFQK